MMLDAGILAVSPSSVWRVLSQTGLLTKWNGKPWKEGTGFAQRLAAHQHWHITSMFPTSTSVERSTTCAASWTLQPVTVNWDIWESMTEADIEIIDFKEFIRISGMTQVRTSRVLPAIEREDRTVVQIAQRGVHPARDAAVAR